MCAPVDNRVINLSTVIDYVDTSPDRKLKIVLLDAEA